MFISRKRYLEDIERAKEEAAEKRDKEREICDLWLKYQQLVSDFEDLKEDFYKLKEDVYKLKGIKETE